jgi:hypothetical protein
VPSRRLDDKEATVTDASERAAERARLEALLEGYQWSQILSTAVRVGVVDAVAAGARTAADVSARLGLHHEAVQRLLRSLAGIGVIRPEGDGFEPTPTLALLQWGEPGSLFELAVLGDVMERAWAGLAGTMISGESAFEGAFGEPLFVHLRDHPEVAAAFNGTMAALSHPVVDRFVADFDIGPAVRIVDVGGGIGHLGLGLARVHPQTEVIVFDLPQVEDEAATFLGDQASGRCRFEAGNFFKAVPIGADIYVLKWVLHDWGDERCLRILHNCRAALPVDGRIVIIERLVPDPLEPGPASNAVLRFDMAMLALGGAGTAQERTLTQYDDLLHSAGLQRRAVMPITEGFVAITATPADA